MKVEWPFWRHETLLGAPLGMFVFALGFLFVSVFSPMSLSIVVYFLMAYFWNLALHSNKLEEKSRSTAYRFSFVKFIFQIHDLILRLPGPFKLSWFTRIIAPTCVGFLYSLLTRDLAVLACLFGAICSEVLLATIENVDLGRRFYRE